jgi:hypothetical protein
MIYTLIEASLERLWNVHRITPETQRREPVNNSKIFPVLSRNIFTLLYGQ